MAIFDKTMKPLFNRILEAKNFVAKLPGLFFVHLWIYAFVWFSINIIGLSFSRIACFSSIGPSKLFTIYFSFNASIFIGALIHSNITRRFPIKYVLSTCILLISLCFCLLPHTVGMVLCTSVFVIMGASLGACLSAVTVSFTVIFRQTSYLLVQLFHLVGSIGTVNAVILYQDASSSHQDDCQLMISPILHGGPRIPSLEKFYLNPSIHQHYMYYAIAALQIPIIVTIIRLDFTPLLRNWISIRRTPAEATPENCQSLTQQSDVNALKLVLLCSVVACIVNIIHALFPFLILAQPNGTILHFQFFAISFMWGRLMAVFCSDYMAPYFLLGCSIFGCGVGCCMTSAEDLLPFGSVILGFFLSLALPALVSYINQGLSLKSSNTMLLMSGHCSGYVLSPLLLTLTSSSNSRLFIGLNFLAIISMVVILVSILSIHAQIERVQASQSGLNLFVSRFLSGESLLKRTRSIRPLISRLRPNSYRRFANRRGLRTPSPMPNSPSPRVRSPSPRPRTPSLTARHAVTEVTVPIDVLNQISQNDKKLLTPTRV
ncbi:unnamed protein product [Caenorhabditis bovis]|uniref:Uncharacterized protein n=1 Tax=Caenorhabditis bovis TaxID=2654633 RepID=A0A8S1F0J8_9PELO|nr:unnamed protein product [Caenorhabditis bovis]